MGRRTPGTRKESTKERPKERAKERPKEPAIRNTLLRTSKQSSKVRIFLLTFAILRWMQLSTSESLELNTLDTTAAKNRYCQSQTAMEWYVFWSKLFSSSETLSSRTAVLKRHAYFPYRSGTCSTKQTRSGRCLSRRSKRRPCGLTCSPTQRSTTPFLW